METYVPGPARAVLVTDSCILRVLNRSPSQALECGCLDAVLELMRALLEGSNGKENRGNGAQRQACMALRNSAVR